MSLSTEGFHLIPHEFIDQGESSFRVGNQCSSGFLDFPLISFKLGDDLIGVAHLLPCDHVVKIWWQLILIWSQIRIFLAPGDFRVTLFVLIS